MASAAPNFDAGASIVGKETFLDSPVLGIVLYNRGNPGFGFLF